MPDIFTKEAVPSYKRTDAHMIDPREVEIAPELNGRLELPQIDTFLADFRNPKIGQIQPVTITKRNGRPVIVDGHCRWRAALELTNNGEGPFDGGVFKLKCVYFVGTDLECFIATIKANVRNEPKAEDDGYNISRLLHNFGMDESEIAQRIYGRTTVDGKPDVKWVRDRAALAELAPEAVQALREGKLKPSAAVALASLTQDVQREKLRRAASEGKKLTTASIKRDDSAPATTPAVPEGGGNNQKPGKVTVDKCREVLQQYIDMDIPTRIQGMTCENAIRTILGEILDEIGGPL